MLVRLRDEAQVDLLEGAWFYEKKNDGLGERFISFVRAELLQLRVNYGSHEKVFGLHRKLDKWKRIRHFRGRQMRATQTLALASVIDSRLAQMQKTEIGAKSFDIGESYSGMAGWLEYHVFIHRKNRIYGSQDVDNKILFSHGRARVRSCGMKTVGPLARKTGGAHSYPGLRTFGATAWAR